MNALPKEMKAGMIFTKEDCHAVAEQHAALVWSQLSNLCLQSSGTLKTIFSADCSLYR